MAVKQHGNSQKKRRGPGKPFQPNNPETGEKDERINRKGRLVPKDARELNDAIDEMFAEEISDDKGNKMKKFHVALNRMFLSKNVAGPIHILDRRFGKVNDKSVSLNIDLNALTDEQLERIASGEDPLKVITNA